MTKFLLNGGNLKSYPDKTPLMIEEMFKVSIEHFERVKYGDEPIFLIK